MILRWAKARDLGLSRLVVAKATKKAMEACPQWATLTQTEKAEAVAMVLMDDVPQAFQDPQVDLDAIIEFLEKLLPIIEKFLALFMAFI